MRRRSPDEVEAYMAGAEAYLHFAELHGVEAAREALETALETLREGSRSEVAGPRGIEPRPPA